MDTQIFDHKYDHLLAMANTKAGRFLLGIKDKEKIIKLTPSSWHIQKDFVKEKAVISATFHTTNIVAEKLMPLLEKLEIANEYKKLSDPYDAMLFYAGFKTSGKYPHIFLTSQTFNASAGIGYITSVDAVFSTARNAASATVTSSTSLASGSQLSGNYSVWRCFTPYDTTAIPIGSSIISAVYTVNCNRVSSAATMYIVKSAQAAISTLAGSDFGGITYSDGGHFAFSTTSTQGISLTSAGLTFIKPAAATKIALVTGDDFNNSYAGYEDLGFISSPTLQVTYTGGVTLIGQL